MSSVCSFFWPTLYVVYRTVPFSVTLNDPKPSCNHIDIPSKILVDNRNSSYPLHLTPPYRRVLGTPFFDAEYFRHG